MATDCKMLSTCVLFAILFQVSESSVNRGPRMRVVTRQSEPDTLMLPSNATSIRENITDNFSCEEKSYGYYADIENECQIFHVCLPVVYADGKNQTFRWSFICPEETIFDQGVFVCVREEDSSIRCEDSEDYYNLNDNFGGRDPEEDISGDDQSNSEMEMDGAQENAEEDPQKRKKPVMTVENKSEEKKPVQKKPEEQKKKNDRRKPSS